MPEEEKKEEAKEGAKEGEGGEEKKEDAVLEENEGYVGLTKKVSPEAFYKRVKEKLNPPTRGDTPEEKMHWSRPRRWDVRLWNVRIENVSDKKLEAFANFVFGGNSEEYQVKSGGSNAEPVIWIAGDPGKELRTPLVCDNPGDGDFTEIEYDTAFEWFGSYMDLETQTLRVEMWNYSRFQINKFDSSWEEPLVNSAKGNIQYEVECTKVDRYGIGKPRAKVYFNLYFQEIYDFELSFSSWRVSDLLPLKEVLHLLETGETTEAMVTRQSVSVAAEADDDGEAPTFSQRLEVVTPPNPKHWSASSRLSAVTASTDVKECAWTEEMQKVYFRGTASDLNNSVLYAYLYSNVRRKDLGLSRAPKGSKGKWTPQCVARLPLTGVLAHGDVKGELVAAPWLYSMPGGETAHRHCLGLLHGHVSADRQPRFQQLEDVADELDLRRRYLFVKVIKVDQVVTPDTRPANEIDTWVEVTFDGLTKRTRVRQDDITPVYNDELIFELVLTRGLGGDDKGADVDEQQLWEEIERKGPVHFDLWTQGPMANEHLGSCEIFLSEILVDDRGQPQKTISKTFKDKMRKTEDDMYVRAFKGSKKLSYIFRKSTESSLFAELWFMPDLSPQAKMKPVRAVSALPKGILSKFQALLDKWERSVERVKAATENRSFPVTMATQFLAMMGKGKKEKSDVPGLEPGCHFLPRFLSVIKPPRLLCNRNAVLHYVSCIPYLAKYTLGDPKEGPESEPLFAYTPDFFCNLGKGESLDHALLHASLMLGLMERAFVCLGTNWRHQRHAWVMTLEADGSVKFWEPFLRPGHKPGGDHAGTFVLRDRLAHPEFVVGGRPPKGLSPDDVQGEIDRRKRLAIQRSNGGGGRQLTLRAPEFHEHLLLYADCSTSLRKDTVCVLCKAKGYARGFRCASFGGCKWDVCWQCASPAFADAAALKATEFDPTKPFDFEYGLPEDSIPVLPYRTVDVVFNQTNVWSNLQHFDPARIFWDLWNPKYWHTFVPKPEGLQPCFQTGSLFREAVVRDEAWLASRRRDILHKLHGAVRTFRAQKNLDTTFVRNPTLIAFLEFGLKLLAELDVCEDSEAEDLHQRIKDWEAILKNKTPPKNKTSAMSMHLCFCDPLLVAEAVTANCKLLESREKSSQFALAVHLRPLPGNFSSLYVCVCEVHKLSDLEVRDEKERRARLREPQEEGAEEEEDALKAMQALRLAQEIQDGMSSAPAQGQTPGVVMLAMQALKNKKKQEQEQHEELQKQIRPAELASTLLAAAAKKPKPGPGGGGAAETDEHRPLLQEQPHGGRLDGPEAEPPQAAGAAAAALAAPGPQQAGFGGGAGGRQDQRLRRDKMTAFDSTLHSKYVQVGSEPPSATYIGTKKEGRYRLQGGVVGNGPLAATAEGKYFEVRVTAVQEGHEDGLIIGVTTHSPDDIGQIPETMEAVQPSWLAGFEGSFWDGVQAAWSPIPWKPQLLAVGDRVGFLVTHEAVNLFQNGKLVARVPSTIPAGVPLYAVIDLLGSTDAVELVVGAKAPEGAQELPRGGAQQAEGKAKPAIPLQGFSHKRKGRFVELSKDGLVASHIGDTGRDMYGGLLSAAPIPTHDGAAYFEIQVEEARPGMGDALAIGVTKLTPADIQDMPGTVDELQSCWVVGFDGQMFDSVTQKWTEVPWSGKDLRVGDRVGVLVTWGSGDGDNGLLQLFVNRKHKVNGPSDVARGPLHAVVDLLGCTASVSYCQNAQAPVATAGAGAKGNAAADVVKVKGAMAAFSRDKLGSLVKLSPDGRSASYLGPTGSELNGSVLGDGPIPRHDVGWYFEVRVDEVKAGLSDGMAIGVTTCSPAEVPDMPQTVDELDPCWAMGFDGTQWDGLTLHWSPCHLEPARLRLGDRVGALVTPSGDLRAVVNGIVVAQGPQGIPCDRPLYAVVDLIGATAGVTLMTGSQPPASAEVVDVGQKVTPKLTDDPFVKPLPREKSQVELPPMRALAKAPLGQHVELSQDGLSATRKGGKKDSGGVVMGDGALPRLLDGGVGFQFVVTAVKPGAPDGLAVGVTARAPANVKKCPDTADLVEPSWLVGFDGATWNGPRKEWGFSDWNPCGLAVGDVVQVGVSGSGDLSVTVNQQQLACHPMKIRTDIPLFALVDLQGATQGISFAATGTALPGAAPRSGSKVGAKPTEIPTQADRTAVMQGFARVPRGQHIELSRDGLAATRKVGSASDSGCVLLGDAPIARRAPGGVAYAFTVTGLQAGGKDGLAVGVTTRAPADVQKAPTTADLVDPCWLVGFDGACWDGVQKDWGLSDFNPGSLAVGDVVQVAITGRGELQIAVNQKHRATHPMRIPLDTPLYLLIDLIGATSGISLHPPSSGSRPGASPASGVRPGSKVQAPAAQAAAPVEAAPLRPQQTAAALVVAPEVAKVATARPQPTAAPVVAAEPAKVTATRPQPTAAPVVAAEPAKVPAPATQEAQPAPRQREGGRAGSAVARTAQAAPPSGLVFARSPVGQFVELSRDRLVATRKGGATDSGCVLMGDGPVPKRPGGGYAFTFTVAAVEPGGADGFAVGVTSKAPAEVRPTPATADLVAPCWMLGFDGASWDGVRQEWGLCSWSPGCLAAGDVVQVAVTTRGELQIAVNHKHAATHPFHIPPDVPVYPILDLLGATTSVALSAPASSSAGGRRDEEPARAKVR